MDKIKIAKTLKIRNKFEHHSPMIAKKIPQKNNINCKLLRKTDASKSQKISYKVLNLGNFLNLSKKHKTI